MDKKTYTKDKLLEIRDLSIDTSQNDKQKSPKSPISPPCEKCRKSPINEASPIIGCDNCETYRLIFGVPRK